MLEPFYEYVVEVNYIHNNERGMIAVKVLATSKYHARDKVHSKYLHIVPDINDYSFGQKSINYKPSAMALN